MPSNLIGVRHRGLDLRTIQLCHQELPFLLARSIEEQSEVPSHGVCLVPPYRRPDRSHRLFLSTQARLFSDLSPTIIEVCLQERSKGHEDAFCLSERKAAITR